MFALVMSDIRPETVVKTVINNVRTEQLQPFKLFFADSCLPQDTFHRPKRYFAMSWDSNGAYSRHRYFSEFYVTASLVYLMKSCFL